MVKLISPDKIFMNYSKSSIDFESIKDKAHFFINSELAKIEKLNEVKVLYFDEIFGADYKHMSSTNEDRYREIVLCYNTAGWITNVVTVNVSNLNFKDGSFSNMKRLSAHFSVNMDFFQKILASITIDEFVHTNTENSVI